MNYNDINGNSAIGLEYEKGVKKIIHRHNITSYFESSPLFGFFKLSANLISSQVITDCVLVTLWKQPDE